MSKYQVTETRCDFCQYGGPYTREHDFVTIADVDLCRWCARPERYRSMSSGPHDVTFRDGTGWDCDCGRSSDDCRVKSLSILTLPRVLAAIPVLDSATAHLHVEGRL